MARFCDLPEELVLEILLSLPAKCVGRFRCVQRSWNVLMNEQRFVAKHLEKNSNSKQSLFMMHSFKCKAPIEDDFRTICNSNADEDEIEIEIDHMEAHLIRNPKRYRPNYKRSSHCNGIICMSTLHIPIIVLLNPALRRFKTFRLKHNRELMLGSGWQLVGFGHDSIDNVYKLVRVLADCTERDAFLDVEVRTLGILHPRRWRKKIRFPFGSSIFCLNARYSHLYSHLYCKGVYYWLAPLEEFDEVRDKREVSEVILSFDMHDEELEIIALPADDNLATIAGFPRKISNMLAVWNHDSVALFRYCESGGRSPRPIAPVPIEMWVMHREHGHGTTTYYWTKHLTIPPLDKVYHPIQLWNNDELILMTQSRFVGNCLASYNLRTHRFSTLPLNPDMNLSTTALAYVKTLEFF